MQHDEMKQTLTTKTLNNMHSPASGRLEVRDAILPGFGVRVTPTHRKTFFVVGRVGDRQVRHTIGTFPILSLSDARNIARPIIAQMQIGTYIDRKAPVATVLTFAEVRRQFVDKYAKINNRDWRRADRLLDKFAALDDRPLASLRRADIVLILDQVVCAGTPIRANRLLAAIKKMFAWALDRGYIDVHPIAGLRPPGKETHRERVLTDREIVSLRKVCVDEGYPFGCLVEMLLLTAQRRGEVAAMRWSNIDFERAIWTIRGTLRKMAEHTMSRCRGKCWKS